jgi:hypothetical protein
VVRAVIARLGALALVAGLALVALPATPRADAATFQPWGRASASDKVLRPGCRHYQFRYVVNPPSNHWAAEVFLSSRGQGLASRAFASGADPARGRSSFRLCRQSVTYGAFKIRMKITYRKSFYENGEGWVRPTYFRMVRPRR